MSQFITTDTNIGIEQDVSVAGVPPPGDFTPEYTITMKLGTDEDTLSALFDTATYKQNGVDPNRYDVVISTNTEVLGKYLNTDSGTAYVNVTGGGGKPVPTRNNDPATVSQKLLDIMSLNLFGTDAAQAAILNDSEFTDIDMIALVNTALVADANHIFERYVALGGVNGAGNDIGGPIAIDFEKLNINSLKIPLYLNGTVQIPGGGAEPSYDWIATFTGNPISKLNGIYSIPLLLDFNADWS
jgi:hypothetical protein